MTYNEQLSKRSGPEKYFYTSSSMKKFPVVTREGRVRMAWAASAMICGVLERCIIISPPRRLFYIDISG